uniref:Glutamate--tRNA ligase n=1 Tax=candidate division WOR-3 bacterium TaxID=2052148 RepID=A0A7C4CAD1_UNCW3
MSDVRVRVAPSPTGALHVGLVRTALYNWLFARRHGGRFVLRIDDTDVGRNMAEVLQPILDGLRWLGLDWDEGPGRDGPHAPYFQSQRAALYEAAVERLLHTGHAYWDYATPEEIEAERRRAVESKQGVFRYSRRWMAEGPGERHRFEAEGRRAVVRLKMPSEGRLELDDMVRGRVEFEWCREQDHVIRRQDGTFLYHLASAVDDAEMGITHIIRAEEHLSNTPRQVFILQALGKSLPRFAHLPYVAEPGSKNKLSKRKTKQYMRNRDFAELVERGERILHGLGVEELPETFSPVFVDFYRQTGFLPEALVNYLALLGWSLDDRTEHFGLKELAASFTLERVIRSPASFDPKRLMAFEVRHVMALPLERRVELVLPFLARAREVEATGPEVREKTRKIVQAAGDRIKVGGDILEYGYFFVADDRLEYDRAALAEVLGRPEQVELLKRFRTRLATCGLFEPEPLEQLLKQFVDEAGIKTGQVIHALRLAVTGRTVGLGMFETLAILGRESCLARIDRTLALVDERGGGDG